MVCCWVNYDENYKYLLKKEGLDKEPGAHPARFRSFGEINYSIPMAIKNLPWLRNIFIVTNGQRPPERLLRYSKVSWIKHHEFIPPEYLPTFNYHAIEPFLYRIPGLSNYFINTADDFFILKKLDKSFFLGVNNECVFFHTPHNLNNYKLNPINVWQNNLKNSDDLLSDKYGKRERKLFPHTPQIFNKNECRTTYENFSTTIKKTANNKVRKNEDVIFRILYTYDFLYKKYGILNFNKLKEISNGNVDIITQKIFKLISVAEPNSDLFKNLELIQKKEISLFCLNDGIKHDKYDDVKKILLNTLKKIS